MVFGTHPRLKKLQNDPIRIEHCGNMINSTTSYKYLGIQLTPSLNMTSHITDSIKKASTRICLLRKTCSFMDTETANLVYQTLILPLFTYCSLSIYGATPEYLKRQIVKIENRVERIVGRPIQTCEQVLVKRICSFVHRCIYNNNVCDVFDNYFKFKTTSVNTRNNGKKLIIPRFKSEAFRASYKF